MTTLQRAGINADPAEANPATRKPTTHNRHAPAIRVDPFYHSFADYPHAMRPDASTPTRTPAMAIATDPRLRRIRCPGGPSGSAHDIGNRTQKAKRTVMPACGTQPHKNGGSPAWCLCPSVFTEEGNGNLDQVCLFIGSAFGVPARPREDEQTNRHARWRHPTP